MNGDTEELVKKLRYLVSLNDPKNGGPYGGYAAHERMKAMNDAASTLAAKEAELERLREAIQHKDVCLSASNSHIQTLEQRLLDAGLPISDANSALEKEE